MPVDFSQTETIFNQGLVILKDYCKVMNRIGSKGFCRWIMPTNNDLTYLKNFELHKRRLKECAKIIGDNGMKLGLEFVGPKTLMSRDEFSFIRTITELRELITEIDENKGAFGKGLMKAELDIKDDLWFFDCHFKEDPVMPGCLGLDAMWQLVGFYLGWLGNPGRGRALGVSTVKFTGEVLKNVKMATYIIDMKRILIKGETTVGLANGILLADDKKIYSADGLKVGLFK